MFAATQYVPELLDGWLIIVYARSLGVDFLAVAKSIRSDYKLLATKVGSVCITFCALIAMAIKTS